jgi:hypothetical protein
VFSWVKWNAGVQIWSCFGQIHRPSSRSSRKSKKLSITPWGVRIFYF